MNPTVTFCLIMICFGIFVMYRIMLFEAKNKDISDLYKQIKKQYFRNRTLRVENIKSTHPFGGDRRYKLTLNDGSRIAVDMRVKDAAMMLYSHLNGGDTEHIYNVFIDGVELTRKYNSTHNLQAKKLYKFIVKAHKNQKA